MRSRQDTYFFMKAGLSFLLLVSILFPTSAGMANASKPTAKPADQAITLVLRNFTGEISEEKIKVDVTTVLSTQKQLIINDSFKVESCQINRSKAQKTCTVTYALNKRSLPVANTGGAIKNTGVTLKVAKDVCMLVAFPRTGADKKASFSASWWKSVPQYLRNKCDDLIKNTSKKTIEIAGLMFAVVREKTPPIVKTVGQEAVKGFVFVGKSAGENWNKFVKPVGVKATQGYVSMRNLVKIGEKNVIGLVGKFLVGAGRFIPWAGKVGYGLLELKLKLEGGIINSVTGGDGNWFGVVVDKAGKLIGEIILYYVGTTVLELGTELVGNGLVHVGTKMSEDPTATIKRTVIIRY